MPSPHAQDDYLKTAHATVPSFHARTGKAPAVGLANAPNEPVNQWGFPEPGPQSPTAQSATAEHYFVDETTWKAILDHGQFDDIVCGSGFCALAYVDAALKRDPFRKILILERGQFWLPQHFQNLPLPFKLVLGGPSETFPWQLSSETFKSEVKFMRGSCPFFGGRSTFWSAWSPKPTPELMRGFPQSMLDTAAKAEFWSDARALLDVTAADKVTSPVFGQQLQKQIDSRLAEGVKGKQIPSANFSEPAQLSVGRRTAVDTTAFDKFSTPGPLLTIYERQRVLAERGEGHPLMIALDTVAQRFEVDPEDAEKHANILHTSRGALVFPYGKTNIILAAGAIPSTTILLNSVGKEQAGRAGTRLSGHFLTHIAARFPIKEPTGQDGYQSHLEIGASYLAGLDPTNNLQYHVQITAIHSPHPETDAEDAGRLCPDYAAAATAEQLAGSERYIVLVCATLGELDEHNPNSWVKHNPENPDVTTNIRLQVTLTDKDKHLWGVMDQATYDAIKVMAGDQAASLQYWHDAADGTNAGSWQTAKPSQANIHVPGIVHETATLYMSDDLDKDIHASVDKNYRAKGCGNVYVTGGALFPSSGSWNPTMTMCGFARDLAHKLVPEKRAGK
ncbi:hypothetical protein CERSUDRAFT_108621 [Gelatoporia subvermispora B]|uniref:Glucose-methanol-choline oxidoreductase C-terminal domain-containing protein n=1 Tax=Ceriporiopsis subvermispora (strain B) TaxID=914234 RepID=M2R3L2_CERS8|nr:hypothetical protein CERSUDRAFT_108621 [Gelatoporia subvermispora B]